jgi:hypothetical protein
LVFSHSIISSWITRSFCEEVSYKFLLACQEKASINFLVLVHTL